MTPILAFVLLFGAFILNSPEVNLVKGVSGNVLREAHISSPLRVVPEAEEELTRKHSSPAHTNVSTARQHFNLNAASIGKISEQNTSFPGDVPVQSVLVQTNTSAGISVSTGKDDVILQRSASDVSRLFGLMTRRKRDLTLSDLSDLLLLIAPEYRLVIHVHNMEASSNLSIDSTIRRLKNALAVELPWPIQDIHVEKINFADSKIEFYFVDNYGQLVPVKDLITADLLSRLSSHVPDLGLRQVSGEEPINLALTVHSEPFWTKPYFPYAVAGASVTVVLTIALLIYCCCCRNGKDKEILDEEVCVGHAIYYPSLKPELAEPTPVQPESPIPIYTASGITTPVPAQPVRIKTKGLLERRGSNASLTLDLNPASDLGRWEGTPPKESTALEYLMSAGNRLSRRDLRNAVKHTKILYEEFWEIPMNHTEKVSVAGSGMKNRYKTIIPNEHSRVILPDIDCDPLNSYINANYIKGYEGESRAYIATQGPMAHTVVDFWRMIWFEKCPIIVMITKLKEKSKPKCENYLPERWGVYGDVEVVIEKIICKKGFIVRHITLRCNGESQTVLHYWYTAWPDHKPPDSPHMLLDLIKEVELRRYQPNDFYPRGPVCVHCSAGIGRTGCFIAISIGIRQLREEHSVDALGIVCAMRIDRGGMIQTHEQYDFVHQALAAYERELGEPSVQSITALTTESVTTP
ncbi:receptor-type tyrosine-protein phosphatase R-like [Physella acuta]|uniref:receptor-type tyrosine-protein phosphatase R-like n=1 Tax=Physella acuta TaxID=109671 RepID=UPI0027DCE417|nr:receptor-type tyrosine-protein phosphatase R-like [Physella acuta]